MQDAKEEVRARLAIEDVIGEYVQLKRSGRYWRGLSPFTNEKTPSFFVTPERDIWHDFSSNKGGDVFSFVMEVEGLDFRGALELLARKAGVDLGQYDERAPRDLAKRKERIITMNNLAMNYFQREMVKSKEASNYISNGRKLSRETVMEWGIGYAPGDSDLGRPSSSSRNASSDPRGATSPSMGDPVAPAAPLTHFRGEDSEEGRPRSRVNLKQLLLKRGFSEPEIRAAGLIGGRGGEMFRSRMMIPLRDGQGQIVGFTGRIIGDGEPKYLNTPATILYDKSRQVFGLNFAKNAIRQEDFTVLVEGNLDVISSHQAGVKNVVACAGTALTRDHLKSLSRLSHNVRLCFDGDRAGLAATERAIALAEPLELKLSVISFNEAKDPDELIQKNIDRWRAAIKQHVPAVEWVINQYAAREDLTTADGKKTLTSQALKLIRNLRDAVEIEFYLKQLSELTGASLHVLEQKMYSFVTDKKPRKIMREIKTPRREYSRRDEQYFLNQIFAIALKTQRLRTILNNLRDEYLTETFAKLKYYLLGEKIEISGEMADKMAELEIIASQELGGDTDERILLLANMVELEKLKLRSKFESLSAELAVALDGENSERVEILNGAVNGLKRDLNLLEKTSSRDDFGGLFIVWDGRKTDHE
ncbi:CHC2 zinc finger domain-containing protein [Candidatus Saccharibacteria bacterium]|nr:CHC2 zinc finger domain-containing protein [Candidatus Saccharibacteria bacterium]